MQMTPKVLRVWAKILRALPTSRLVVKCKPFCCDSVRDSFLAKFQKLGVESLRVDLLPLILLNHDHMQAYSLMDIRYATLDCPCLLKMILERKYCSLKHLRRWEILKE
jgi:protein O-GlcNAc transferase